MSKHIADAIYFNAIIYSADSLNRFHSAMAVKDGIILGIGNDLDILAFKGDNTKMINMMQQFMMPGLIDGHLHPFWGASQSLSCDLAHKPLSKVDVITSIQSFYNERTETHPHEWLIVRGWLQPAMTPVGSELTKKDLDYIATDVPIIVFSNDCHLLVCNSLALTQFKTVQISPSEMASGILEDAPAMQAFDEITRYAPEYALTIAKHAQSLLNAQGITTVMDARVDEITLQAFNSLAERQKLTLRLLGAKEIHANTFSSQNDIPNVIEQTQRFIAQYSSSQMATQATTTVTHIKFFIDGVLQAPLHTALLRQPYHLKDRTHSGDCYYDKELLTALLTQSNQMGWHIHMHTVGDAAIDFAMDCIEDAQRHSSNENVRASLAHNELTAPDHYERFAKLNIIATQSLQWSAMDANTHQSFVDLLNDERMSYFECAGKFYDHNVKIAYGSDWPIDPLHIWHNFQAGMNRQLDNDNFKHNNDRDLTITEVLRSATIDAAYMLGQDHNIGSIEAGKFADFIVLDQNPFELDRYKIHTVKAKQVFLGGKPIKIS